MKILIVQAAHERENRIPDCFESFLKDKVSRVSSVEEVITSIKENTPGLVIVDVEIESGSSFKVFEELEYEPSLQANECKSSRIEHNFLPTSDFDIKSVPEIANETTNYLLVISKCENEKIDFYLIVLSPIGRRTRKFLKKTACNRYNNIQETLRRKYRELVEMKLHFEPVSNPTCTSVFLRQLGYMNSDAILFDSCSSIGFYQDLRQNENKRINRYYQSYSQAA